MNRTDPTVVVDRATAFAARLLRRPPVVIALLLLAALPNLRLPPAGQMITAAGDLDGYMKLQGIQRDGLGEALGYFVGDDPQGVHTFRPLPALMLWTEYRAWGHLNWPYLLMNWLWFVAAGVAVYYLCTAVGMPALASLGVAGWAVAHQTRGSDGVLRSVATRHDLVCTVAALLAVCWLVAYLREGQRKHLIGFVLAALAAYLSKEMALALLPLSWGLVAVRWRQGAERRRVVRALGAALAVAMLWFAWYKLAELNMGPAGAGHGFGEWLYLWRQRAPRSLVVALLNLSQPAGEVLRYFMVPFDAVTLLFTRLFWFALANLLIQLAAIMVLWRHERLWLATLYLWKVATWLPVLPLQATWSWHEYMPHVLDGMLLIGAAAVVFNMTWLGRCGRQRLRAGSPADLRPPADPGSAMRSQ